jgi:hypothetical protein
MSRTRHATPAAGARMARPRLEVELVPEPCWWSNVRSLATREQWDVMRRRVYQAAHWRCELCGGRGPEHPVECHEMWAYDDTTATQQLVRLLALWPACHEVKHLGLACVNGREHQALAHLARVNGWPWEFAAAHAQTAFALWHARSQHPWRLDLRGLRRYLPPHEVVALQARASWEREPA